MGYFHLLHVGGPSQPNIKWEGDNGEGEGSFNYKYIVTIHVLQHWDFYNFTSMLLECSP